MATATEYPHVEVDETTGMPYVRGTRFKLVQIVLDRLAYSWDADEIQRQHPQLTLAQVHAALAYYYDHQADVDALIERRHRQAEELLKALPHSPATERLRAIKRQQESV
jgi:uncharacterized protein (DUF433 family)